MGRYLLTLMGGTHNDFVTVADAAQGQAAGDERQKQERRGVVIYHSHGGQGRGHRGRGVVPGL